MKGTYFNIILLSVFLLMTVPASPDSQVSRATEQEGIPIREATVVSGDVELFVRLAGSPESGRVVLALNGGPGISSRYMQDLEALAGDDLALVTFDQRGVGRSSKPSLETGSFTFEKYLQDIEAIRHALGIDSFHLLGHSWGGILALRYAVEYPQRIDSLILIGSAPLRDKELKTVLASIRNRVIELMQQGIIDPKLAKHSDIYPAYLSDPRYEPPIELIPDLDEEVQNLTFEAIAGYDLAKDVAGIEKKVLILWGEDDIVGLDTAAAIEKALTGAEVTRVVVEDCGHFWQEKPQEFFSSLREFLKK